MDDLQNWINLSLTGNISADTLLAALAEHQSLSALLNQSHSGLKKAGFSENQVSQLLEPDQARIEQTLEWLQQPTNQIITLLDESYPPQLRQISKPPLLLYVTGDLTGNGTVRVEGAAIVEEDVNVSGTLDIDFNSSVLANLAQSGSATVTPGSWKDWKEW